MTPDLTDRLIRALEPLAAIAARWDDDPVWIGRGKPPSSGTTQVGICLTLGHAREARAAIAAAREGGS